MLDNNDSEYKDADIKIIQLIIFLFIIIIIYYFLRIDPTFKENVLKYYVDIE